MQTLPRLSDKTSRSWRWNVDPVWAHFSTMIQENHCFTESETEFERHRASKACIYFGVAAVEAFHNDKLRHLLQGMGHHEDDISEIVASPRKRKEKWKLLESSSFGSIFSDKEYEKFREYKEIRNEITHPSRPDQLIFDYLEIVDTKKLTEIVKYILVKTCELQGDAFKYWMLGWNYIGFNKNEMEPTFAGNLQSFYWSLINMKLPGFVNFPQELFLKKCMTGHAAFMKLQAALDEYPFEIEPKHLVFSAPRLTRCWWNHSILDSDSIENCENDSSRPGCKVVWAIVNDRTRECMIYFNSINKAEYICRVSFPGCRVVMASYSEKDNNVIVLQ